MNRRERRAAQKLGAGAVARPGVPVLGSQAIIPQLMALAHRHHLAGELAEAETACRRILDVDPNHVVSLHRLGVIAHRLGRHEEAVVLIGKAIAINEFEPTAHFNIGLVYMALARPGDAAAHYARATALKPDYAEAHMNLGIIRKEEGGLDEAIALYQLALTARPGYAEAHSNLGVALAVQGKLDEAVACYQRALALNPQAGETHNNLGVALKQQGKLDEAARHFRQALTLKGDYAEAHMNLGATELARDNAAEALGLLMRALALKETGETKALFVKCVANFKFTSAADDVRRLVTRALSESWDRPRLLANVGASLVRQNPVIAGCLERAASAWPRRLSAQALFGASGLAAICGDPLLAALLQSAPNCDVELERLLTAIRFAMLRAATEAQASSVVQDSELGFLCALARQCWINEYVFDATEDEWAHAGLLRERLTETLAAGEIVPVPWLIAVASYFPLHSLSGAVSLLDKRWPDPVEELLTWQLREPLQERHFAETTSRLTGIEDGVSRLVRQQYEENPYPRWVSAAPALASVRVDDWLRRSFPSAWVGDFAGMRDIEVLVAGCGTGQHSIESARRFAGSNVLAVDLSLASLAYAQRKTSELGLRNIVYAQADILKLGSIGRSFDIIESSGVLHHLADPMQGWRVLESLLRPGGLMRLGFYSEVARQAIVAGREFIAETRYGRTAADIRRCRQDLLASGDAPLLELTRARDFFTTSECRDLLFHVQEHRLTLPTIKSALAELDLEFLGFDIDETTLRQFRSRFPEDRSLLDLDLWHVFESENPDTFSAMYQFWAQKPRESAPN